MDTLIRFISATFKNIFKVIGFLIFIGILIYFIYFLIGYFSLPSEKIKNYSLDSKDGKLEIKTSFRAFDNNYHSSIMDREGNIYTQILFTPKDAFSKNDIAAILIIFKDKDGFELFKTEIPYKRISTSGTDFNGKMVKESDSWNRDRFSFKIYSKIDSFDYIIWEIVSKNKNKQVDISTPKVELTQEEALQIAKERGLVSQKIIKKSINDEVLEKDPWIKYASHEAILKLKKDGIIPEEYKEELK